MPRCRSRLGMEQGQGVSRNDSIGVVLFLAANRERVIQKNNNKLSFFTQQTDLGPCQSCPAFLPSHLVWAPGLGPICALSFSRRASFWPPALTV